MSPSAPADAAQGPEGGADQQAGAAAPKSSGSLASTGAAGQSMLAAGLLLPIAGAGLLVARRRSQRAS